MLFSRPRCRRNKTTFLIYCLSTLLFAVTWMLLTLLIMVAQEQYVDSLENDAQGRGQTDKLKKPDDDSYMGRGIQVVVGHFNGNLPVSMRDANLTDEQRNANRYSPVASAGEMGRGVKLNVSEEKTAKDLFQINQFNILASDMIPLNRSLPDLRKKACRAKANTYPTDLPDTSVIIVYHNEAWSTLLRTVTSVINRSPSHLLREVIIVDDNSSREFLKAPLDDYAQKLSKPVKIIRATHRVGLIRARLMGAKEAKGDVLTFLDSHCECTEGWLQPLLARIAEDRTAVVCPVIDVINDKTFAFQKGIEMFRGGFNWNLQFRWYSVPPAQMKLRTKDGTAPIKSPTMAGGLFSMERRYFEELGTYDSQMDIWGGENLEMSFRIWQCGGKVEILPCSHVGHVFRKASPHDFPNKSSGRILNSNLVRVAEVWMDQWKHVFYKTAPQALELAKSIDVSDRIELRSRLQCKDFAWYLSNVWPEHFLPKPQSFFGRVENVALNACLHLSHILSHNGFGTTKRLNLVNCTKDDQKRSNQLQLWVLDESSGGVQIKGDEHQCLSATQVNQQWLVQLKECQELDSEFWLYDQHKNTLVHQKSGLCLDEPIETPPEARETVRTPSLQHCARRGARRSSQQWRLYTVEWLPPITDTNRIGV